MEERERPGRQGIGRILWERGSWKGIGRDVKGKRTGRGEDSAVFPNKLNNFFVGIFISLERSFVWLWSS